MGSYYLPKERLTGRRGPKLWYEFLESSAQQPCDALAGAGDMEESENQGAPEFPEAKEGGEEAGECADQAVGAVGGG